MKKYFGEFGLLAAGLIFSFYPFLIRQLNAYLSDLAQITWRITLASLFIVVVIKLTRTKINLSLKQILICITLGLSSALTVLFFTYSVNSIKATNTVFFFYIANLSLGIIIGRLFFKEKLSFKKSISLGILLIGLIVITGNNFESNIAGLFWALLSGFADNIGNAIRKSLKGLDKNVIQLFQYSVVAVIFLIVSIINGGEILPKTMDLGFILIITIYALTILMVNMLTLYGFQKVDLNIGTIFISSELFFAVIVNWLLLKETPYINEIIGGLLILFAIIFLNVNSKTISSFKVKIFKLMYVQ